MKICPQCGYREQYNFRTSRFDYNADYVEPSEGPQEIVKQLEKLPKGTPIIVGPYHYYLRGKKKIYLYRVPNEDYKINRERNTKAP